VGSRQVHFFGFAFFTADKWKGRRMKEAVTDAKQRPGFPLRSESKSLRSLQGGDENRGQLFALLPAGIGHVLQAEGLTR
jgi:hypothetical protein